MTWQGTITQDVPAGATVTLVGSTATVPSGVTVTVGEGVSISGAGTVQVAGTLNVAGVQASEVTVSGVGFEAQAGGQLSVMYVQMDAPPAALKVLAGATSVMFSFVTVQGAGLDLDIRGGADVVVDHCSFDNGGGARISGQGTYPEIRHSHLSTGGNQQPDFLVLSSGASMYAHHNLFQSSHCAIHVNGTNTTDPEKPLRFEDSIFDGSSYAIMMYAAGTAQMHNNEIRSAANRDVFHATNGGVVDATGNYFTAGCPADGARGPGGNAGPVTYNPCASGPITGVGPQP